MEIAMNVKDNNNAIAITNRPVSSVVPETRKEKKVSFFRRRKENNRIPPRQPQTPNVNDKKTNRKKTFKKLFYAILTVALLAGGFYTYKVFTFTGNIGLKIKPGDIFNPIKKDPELKKDSSGKYTNVLLVGIDSRDEKSKLKNTDTIIIASYNHSSGDTVMYSIPRDFWVEVPDEGWYSKINALYAHGESKNEGSGLKYLSKALKTYTGLEVQYYAMIDLQGFKKIIDTVGGITVNVENSFTDYCYPADKDSKVKVMRTCEGATYLTENLTFTKGPQNMDGATALKYARSRKGSAPEGSDFARAKRQQKVIDAVKSKVVTSETLLNPSKVLEIMDAVEKNIVISEFTTEDVQAGIDLILKQKENNGKTYNFVFDYYIGNSRIMVNGAPNAGNLSVISTKAGLGNYSDIKEMVKLTQEDPQLYKEDAVIRVYDTGLGYYNVLSKTSELQKKYPYLNILFMGTLFYDKTGITVYNHTEGEQLRTLSILSDYYKTQNKTKPDYILTTLNGEDITILFGKEEVMVQPPTEAVQ